MRSTVMVVMSVLFLSLSGCATEDPEGIADDVASSTSAVEEGPMPTEDDMSVARRHCLANCQEGWDEKGDVCENAYNPFHLQPWELSTEKDRLLEACKAEALSWFQGCNTLCTWTTPADHGGTCLPQLPGCGI